METAVLKEDEKCMARAIFSHELGDPDFQWLLSSYAEQRQTTAMVDVPCLPVVLIVLTPEEKAAVLTGPHVPTLSPEDTFSQENIEDPSTD